MGLVDSLLRAKNSAAGRRLKRLPVLRALVPSAFDTAQRRLFFAGLADLEANCRETRSPLSTTQTLLAVQDGRDRGDEFSKRLSEFSTSKLHDLGYQYVYGPLLLPRRDDHLTLLEIGIGTTDNRLASSMSAGYEPGTSLRAWRALFSVAEIFGADIDERILVNEDGISSFWVDQLSRDSLVALSAQIGPVDIVIDDGLHTPEAAINSLRVLLPTVRPGGTYVLEDALMRFDACWSEAAKVLRPWFNTRYYSNAELNRLREPREDAGVFVVVRPV